jgi:hypothetical protein
VTVQPGAWRCPSGNEASATFWRDGEWLEHVEIAWDRLPLSPSDMVWYIGRILPAITARVAEYKEEPMPRAVLVVRV